MQHIPTKTCCTACVLCPHSIVSAASFMVAAIGVLTGPSGPGARQQAVLTPTHVLHTLHTSPALPHPAVDPALTRAAAAMHINTRANSRGGSATAVKAPWRPEILLQNLAVGCDSSWCGRTAAQHCHGAWAKASTSTRPSVLSSRALLCCCCHTFLCALPYHPVRWQLTCRRGGR
jgi:hypothetical protein